MTGPKGQFLLTQPLNTRDGSRSGRCSSYGIIEPNVQMLMVAVVRSRPAPDPTSHTVFRSTFKTGRHALLRCCMNMGPRCPDSSSFRATRFPLPAIE